MVTVYILTFKRTGQQFYFTSLLAIFHRFDYDTLKIKYSTASVHKFKIKPYENKNLKIERIKALSVKDSDKAFKEFGGSLPPIDTKQE